MTTDARIASPAEALAALEPVIREHADASEAQQFLARPIVDALVDAGVFRLRAPKTLGGAETDPGPRKRPGCRLPGRFAVRQPRRR